jgi:hypothetical protein
VTHDDAVAELVCSIPWFAPGDVVYVERRGDDFSWRAVEGELGPTTDELPDAWLFHMGPWPTVDRAAAFVDDLLAELESMTGGDRCRWPLDQPWPHSH